MLTNASRSFDQKLPTNTSYSYDMIRFFVHLFDYLTIWVAVCAWFVWVVNCAFNFSLHFFYRRSGFCRMLDILHIKICLSQMFNHYSYSSYLFVRFFLFGFCITIKYILYKKCFSLLYAVDIFISYTLNQIHKKLLLISLFSLYLWIFSSPFFQIENFKTLTKL